MPGSLLVFLVPGVEGLLGIRLVLKDAQQVTVAEGIDGLGQAPMIRCESNEKPFISPDHL